jgi:hypothetical protein
VQQHEVFVPFDRLGPDYGISYCRVHLRRLVDKQLFPAPVQVSPNRVAWRQSDLIRYQESLPLAWQSKSKPAPRRLDDAQKADRYARRRERLDAAE